MTAPIIQERQRQLLDSAAESLWRADFYLASAQNYIEVGDVAGFLSAMSGGIVCVLAAGESAAELRAMQKSEARDV